MATKNKIPNVTKRKDGRYCIKITVDGSSASLYGKSKHEVIAKYQVTKQKIANSTYMLDTLEFEIDAWLKKYKFGKVKLGTYDRYEETLTSIKKYNISHKSIDEITFSDVQDMINNAVVDCYSISSITKMKQLTHAYFEFAIMKGYVVVNPAKYAIIPHEESVVKKTKKVEELSQSAIDKMYSDYLNNNYRWYHLHYLFLLNTGLRIGELLGLKWSDIDLKSKFFKVNRNVYEVRKRNGSESCGGCEVIEQSTKTRSSERPIPLNENAIKILKSVLHRNEKLGLNPEFVFCNSHGNVTQIGDIERAFSRYLSNNNLGKYVLHSLRHTFGSILLRNGVEIKTVSELLGHSSVDVTYNIYIHVLKEQKIKAINLINVM